MILPLSSPKQKSRWVLDHRLFATPPPTPRGVLGFGCYYLLAPEIERAADQAEAREEQR